MQPTTLAPPTVANERAGESKGMLLGLAGVAIFSLTLPMTRIAVQELDAAFVTLGRALGAAVLSAAWLRWRRAPRPGRADLPGLAMVALGCVLGFPLLSSIAMKSLPAAHGAVLVGALPLCTALYAALRGYERPSRGFWALAGLGSALVTGFALLQGGGRLQGADLAMLAAVGLGAAGYAEGARLARRLGGLEVISWALLLAAPFAAVLLLACDAGQFGRLAGVSLRAWLALAYITVFSMYVGFCFWYRGLALGGTARVGQTQLLQPFLTLGAAAALLGEPLSPANCAFALAVIAIVALGRRMQVRR